MDDQQITKGTVYKFRFIDHGAQYRVYEILTADGSETGRVIKVPLSFEESKRVLEPHLIYENLLPKEVDRRVHTLMVRKQQVSGLVQGMFATDRKLMVSLGNLKLVPMLAEPPKDSPDYFMPLFFTQDFVMPMSRFMHTFRFMQVRAHAVTLYEARQARQLLRAVVDLHYRLWEYGIFDITFKLENIGVVMRGRNVEKAVLVDGAEHTYDINEAESVLKERKWHNCLDPKKTDHLFLPIVLHEEFMDTLNNALTDVALKKHWQKKSKAIERRAARRLMVQQALTRDSKKSLTLWMERQSLRGDLHRGIPRECIDGTHIPYADLMILLQDTRAGKLPPNELSVQEDAERAMFANDDKITSEIYRHMLHLSRNP